MHVKIITALTLLPICLSPLVGQDAVTYTKDISPIIYNNCTVCHRDGEIGPFPLTNFEEVRDEAYTIQLGHTRRLHATVDARSRVQQFLGRARPNRSRD